MNRTISQKITGWDTELAGLGNATLERSFGTEYDNLTAAGALVVLDDFLHANTEGKIDSDEYRRRIGPGKLQAYADCLLVHYPNLQTA